MDNQQTASPACLLPQNQPMERALLSSILHDEKNLAVVMESDLAPPDFYNNVNRMVFAAITSLYKKKEQVDIITAFDEVCSIEGDSAVDFNFFIELGYRSTPEHAIRYAKSIKRKAIFREIVSLADELASLAYAQVDEVELFLKLADKIAYQIHKNRKCNRPILLRESINQNMAMMDSLFKSRNMRSGISSGYMEIDTYTGGVPAPGLTIIAGRPYMYKTALACNMAHNMCVADKELVVVIFSLDESEQNLGMRMLSINGGVTLNRMRSGFISEADITNISASASELFNTNIYVEGNSCVGVVDIKVRAKKIKELAGRVDMLIIDDLQLIYSPEKSNPQPQDLSEIVRLLNMLAKDMAVPIVLLSQLPELPYDHPSPRPRLIDLREYGAIYEHANMVWLLHHETFYGHKLEEKSPIDTKNVELIVAKNDYGPIGTMHLKFDWKCCKFEKSIMDEVDNE